MKKLLLDIDIILDILLDRKPHVVASSQIWVAIETGRVKGIVPAHGVTTIYYLIRRAIGAATARRTIGTILQVLEVAAVDSNVIQSSLLLAWPDFEDAVTAAAAEAAGCDAIITRDPKGFPDSQVQVLTPETAAALIVKRALSKNGKSAVCGDSECWT
jgi:predicted nucleic acid-binding protein